MKRQDQTICEEINGISCADSGGNIDPKESGSYEHQPWIIFAKFKLARA